MDNRFQTYKTVDVNTTNRGKIVVMLFSGAITFLNKTKMYMERKDYANKGKFLAKTLDIIDELNISLDLEKGQDVAKNLKSLYAFINRYLSEANIENNVEKIERIITILESLKNAFEEILQKPEYQEAQNINRTEQPTNIIRRFA